VASRDEEWWHSDDSGSDSSGSGDEEREQATEAELDEWLIDPDVDAEDAKWVEEKRCGRESDAILSCPACLTTLCIDCQQHEVYLNQYRAMFVMNCAVGETLSPAKTQGEPQGAGVKRGLDEEVLKLGSNHGDEASRCVRCEVCGVEVGVRDGEDVYHFFNVFPSMA
jgi:hypothetical protein